MNDLSCYETGSNAWRTLPVHPPIAGRGGAGLVATPAALYVIGGFAGAETNDMHRFDLSSETWTSLAADPVFSPRSVLVTCSFGNKLVAFGGEVQPSDKGHSGAGAFTNETWICETRPKSSDGDVTVQWAEVPSVDHVTPAPRGWLSAGVVGRNKMVLFGGNAADNSRLDDLWLMELL